MKSIKSFAQAMVLCCIVSAACKESTNPPDKIKQINSPLPLSEYLGKPISKDFSGNVSDSANNPLENATITIGNKSTETNVEGHFIIKNSTVNSGFIYIEAEKENYKKMAFSLTTSETENSISIVLHKTTEPCLFWFCEHNHLLVKNQP